MSRNRAVIQGIASHLPDSAVTNEQLSREFVSWDEVKIREKTGIVSRRIAAPDEYASDLGVAAARSLFDSGIVSPSEVDFLLYCTQSPDQFLPATSCLIQDRLGLATSSGAIDINQGCSGFVYGLAVASGLVESGAARRVLLITADTYSKYLNPRDRSVRAIFGDGAAATLIGGSASDDGAIGPFVFGTDGRGANNLIVRSGGLRHPTTAETAIEREDSSGNWRSDQNLFMNGGEIFAFTLKAVPDTVQELLREAGHSIGEIDHFVFHQANEFMLERLRVKLEIPVEKFAVDVRDTGNTVSSSIPIALERLRAARRIGPGDRVMLVGFGVGYSWAAAMLRGF